MVPIIADYVIWRFVYVIVIFMYVPVLVTSELNLQRALIFFFIFFFLYPFSLRSWSIIIRGGVAGNT